MDVGKSKERWAARGVREDEGEDGKGGNECLILLFFFFQAEDGIRDKGM